MKKTVSAILFTALTAFSLSSCSNEKPEGNDTDSLSDTVNTHAELSDSTRAKFRKLVTALPVPFEMLNQFSGAKLPFKGELLNKSENASQYPDADAQAVNLGIYGADLAYLISQDKLAESGAYLKSVRRLSDAVVVPSAFDESFLKRYESNSARKDSMQALVHNSYERIDSTLFGNDRLALATLVIYGGWLESIYLTTQHIGDEKQNEKNKVLFDMLALQQPHIDNMTDLLGTFQNDRACAWLYTENKNLKTLFPTSNLSPEEFSAQLKLLREKVTEIRSKLIQVS